MTTDQELEKLEKAYEDAAEAHGKANSVFYDAQKALEATKEAYYKAYRAYKKALNQKKKMRA